MSIRGSATGLLQTVLCAQVAEVAILQLIVLVCVHVGEDLQNRVTLKSKLHLINDVGKVGESDIASSPQVECPEGC